MMSEKAIPRCSCCGETLWDWPRRCRKCGCFVCINCLNIDDECTHCADEPPYEYEDEEEETEE
jgi:hypothetical protein